MIKSPNFKGDYLSSKQDRKVRNTPPDGIYTVKSNNNAAGCFPSFLTKSEAINKSVLPASNNIHAGRSNNEIIPRSTKLDTC